jgi:hypothetical protein
MLLETHREEYFENADESKIQKIQEEIKSKLLPFFEHNSEKVEEWTCLETLLIAHGNLYKGLIKDLKNS